jgi:hypothetical protein
LEVDEDDVESAVIVEDRSFTGPPDGVGTETSRSNQIEGLEVVLAAGVDPVGRLTEVKLPELLSGVKQEVATEETRDHQEFVEDDNDMGWSLDIDLTFRPIESAIARIQQWRKYSKRSTHTWNEERSVRTKNTLSHHSSSWYSRCR